MLKATRNFKKGETLINAGDFCLFTKDENDAMLKLGWLTDPIEDAEKELEKVIEEVEQAKIKHGIKHQKAAKGN